MRDLPTECTVWLCEKAVATTLTPHTLFSSLTVREEPSGDRDGLLSGDTSTAVMKEGVVSNGTGVGWGWGM